MQHPRNTQINVAVIGLGPIGLAAAGLVARDPMMRLTGLADTDPKKAGKRLADLGAEIACDVKITDDVEAVGPTDVAILCTGSHFDRIAPTLRQLMRIKAHVVSTCEEMAWPWLRHPHLADVIAAEARAAKVALVATGVNPGFVMDLLPVVLASMVTGISAVKVTRVVDAATRRQPLQRKVGATMTPEHFRKLAGEGRIGHMGIGESVVMLAQGLGRHPTQKEVRTTIVPLLAERGIDCALGTIAAGQVRGMQNTGRWSGAGLEIELSLTMAVGENEPRDEIYIVGDRTLMMTIPGGTPGDTATVAALVNVARQMPNLLPGLHTMLDLPAVGSR